MAQLPNLPDGIRSVQVAIRFALRMVVLSVFATLGNGGFSKTFAVLLWMSAVFSVLAAAIRREPLLDSALTHWDEAAGYGIICCAAIVTGQATVQLTP